MVNKCYTRRSFKRSLWQWNKYHQWTLRYHPRAAFLRHDSMSNASLWVSGSSVFPSDTNECNLLSSTIFFYRRSPYDFKLNWDVFRPFRFLIWVGILASIALVSLFMKAIFDWERKLIKSVLKRCLSIGYTFVVTFGAICQQGTQLSFRLLSGKFLVVFLLLGSIIIHNYYTSVLVSTLIKSTAETGMHTIWDLADSELRVGLNNSTLTKSVLEVLNWSENGFRKWIT